MNILFRHDHGSSHHLVVTIVRAGGFMLLALSWLFSLYAPLWISWENGPLENAQVAVLVAAAVVSIRLWRDRPGRDRNLWIAAAIIWLILAARELSWGAVFLTPVGVTEHGPTFSSALLWYRPAVTPAVAIALVAAIFALAAAKPLSIAREAWGEGRLPVFDFIAFAGAMLISTASEGHMGLSLGGWTGDHQVLEETVELAAYLFLFSGQLKLSVAPGQK